jgi:hypothetical protein
VLDTHRRSPHRRIRPCKQQGPCRRVSETERREPLLPSCYTEAQWTSGSVPTPDIPSSATALRYGATAPVVMSGKFTTSCPPGGYAHGAVSNCSCCCTGGPMGLRLQSPLVTAPRRSNCPASALKNSAPNLTFNPTSTTCYLETLFCCHQCACPGFYRGVEHTASSDV